MVPSAARCLRRDEVIANEQVLARELIVELDHPGYRPRPPAQTRGALRSHARANSRAGTADREHTAAILAEIGLEAAEIERAWRPNRSYAWSRLALLDRGHSKHARPIDGNAP